MTLDDTLVIIPGDIIRVIPEYSWGQRATYRLLREGPDHKSVYLANGTVAHDDSILVVHVEDNEYSTACAKIYNVFVMRFDGKRGWLRGVRAPFVEFVM